MLTPLDEQGLVVMFRCLFGYAKHDKVKVNYNPKKGIHFAIAKLKDAGTVFLQEQNQNRSSIYSDAARNGIPIAWPFINSEYAGPVVAQLPGQLEPRVYDPEELRLLLNPMIGELKMKKFTEAGEQALAAMKRAS